MKILCQLGNMVINATLTQAVAYRHKYPDSQYVHHFSKGFFLLNIVPKKG